MTFRLLLITLVSCFPAGVVLVLRDESLTGAMLVIAGGAGLACAAAMAVFDYLPRFMAQMMRAAR